MPTFNFRLQVFNLTSEILQMNKIFVKKFSAETEPVISAGSIYVTVNASLYENASKLKYQLRKVFNRNTHVATLKFVIGVASFDN